MPDVNIDALRSLDEQRQIYLAAENEWVNRARPNQVLPLDGWNVALARCGRGWGKTQVGSQWVLRECMLYPGIVLHVVAPTYGDLHGTIFEGESGLLATIPSPLIKRYGYSPYPFIEFHNGSYVRGFSAEAPERLRGPQCHKVWGDEVAAWGANAEKCLYNIDFSTRLSYTTADGVVVQPQKFFTTTPRPLEFVQKLNDEASFVITGSTYENRANLAQGFFDRIVQYEGTKIGRQEIHGEIIDISESAIIKKSWIRLWPALDEKGNDNPLPWFEHILLSFDTAFTERTWDKDKLEQDPTAFGAWGVFMWQRKWNFMLLDAWDEYLGFPDLLERARLEWKKVYGRRTKTLFKPVVGPAWYQEQQRRPDIIVIEDKGSGISLRQTLERERVACWPYNPGQADKTARLHAVSHLFKAGRVWALESAHPERKGKFRDWCEPWLNQLCVYSGPNTTLHDDYVDMTSQAVRVFGDKFVTEGVGASIPQHLIGGTDIPAEVLPEDREHPEFVDRWEQPKLQAPY